MEVWRRSIDAFDPEKYLPCQPSDQQLAVASLHPPTSQPGRHSPNPGRRGIYVPFAVLQVLDVARASRFVYPNLVVAYSRGRKAYIWDIPTSRLIETIDVKPHPLQPLSEENAQPTEDLRANIRYVELSQDHVFICWDREMVVYRRSPTEQEQGSNSAGIFSVSSTLVARPSTVLGNHIHTYPLVKYSSSSQIHVPIMR
ncbi:hypothetical protein FRC02_010334 [Tulasnella sp. 418]|nr:hypothetical protein FRC02_010334 [Tulasnella sp. 418]